MSAPDPEDLAIALTAAALFEPEPLYRLVERRSFWLGPRPTATLARRVGVKLDDLRQARRLSEQATALAARERERAAAIGARLLVPSDEAFPRGLADLERPPPVLYCRGELPARPALAIVGPRNPDPWALEATRVFARRFAQAGLVVVSGFARGIDRAAHEAAVQVEGGLSIAVLGCGLTVDYPRGQQSVRETIAKNGAVVSEFPLDAEPRPHYFPVRNRLIAALGWGTLVVQAAHRSGSLITARLALDLGREVMALPGRVFDRRSQGSNALIRDGARCVLDPEEVLDTLPLAVQDALARLEAPPAHSTELPEVHGPAHRLLTALRGSSDPWSAEQAALQLELPVAPVLALLAELELDGRVRRLPGARFLVVPSSIP